MFCGKCGAAVSPDMDFCVRCGARAPVQDPNASTDVPVTAPKSVAEASDEILWRAYIGKNADFYVPRFAKYSQTGSTFPSWHWPAFFVAFWWALYRNAWGAAALFFFLPWLLFIPFGVLFALLGNDHDGLTTAATVLFYATTYVLPATLANGVYFRLAQKRVAEARALSPDATAQIAYLSGRGRGSSALVVLLTVFVGVSLIGIVAAIALPAYQDYVTRSKVSQAIIDATPVKDFVAKYWKDNGAIPAPSNVAEVVNSAPHPYIEKIDINSENGVLTITLSRTLSLIDGKSLQLRPREDAQGQVAWQCVRGEVPARYVPTYCRGE
jgi:Pilin (bacterial filament)